ncbi:MAG: MATE family efflux transporter, partial [Chitinophagaceae bacterium]
MQEFQASSLQVKTDYKAILGFALPIAMAILVPQINFIINNIFLGSLGEKQLALGGLTGIFYLIFAVLGQGINAGLQSLIARSAGENNTQSIASLYQTAVRMVLIFSLLCILFVWFFAPSILQWAMHDKANAQIAADFLRIRIMGLPFLYLFLMRNSLLVGVNQSRYLVIGTASEAVVNVFFDYALIYGKFGLPALGFNGAAVASIIAEFTAQA